MVNCGGAGNLLKTLPLSKNPKLLWCGFRATHSDETELAPRALRR
jgi:hypothetical protein